MPQQADPARPMRPVYPYNTGDEAILLFDGTIEVDGSSWPGRIELGQNSGPRLRWHVEAHDDAAPTELGAVTLKFRRDDRGHTVTGFRSSANGGWLNTVEIGAQEQRLGRVRAHWMNLPRVHGSAVLTERDERGERWWAGRWCTEVDGWRVVLDSRPDYSNATTNAANDRIFLLTHVMEVCRADGGHFTVEQAESVLEHLRITLSFAFGHWVSPVLPRGYDDHDLVVWERWSAPICDPLRKVPPGWLYTGRPDDLTELVGRAIPALSDRTCPRATRLQMQMATSAMESGFVEQRILTAAPALENLGWTRLVARDRWSRTQYRDRFAQDRLRYLLEEARIATDIDPSLFPALAAFAESRRLDGPGAVTKVRNQLVHPERLEEEVQRHDGLVENVWLMLRRYLTLLVLHDIGYRGAVVDPGKLSGWVWEAEPVPWSAGSSEPPMPPDKRALAAARSAEQAAEPAAGPAPPAGRVTPG